MNPARPIATAVAVRDGKIVGVGTEAELAARPDTRVDRQFADTVLMPGFIEGHAHLGTGSIWDLCILATSIASIRAACGGAVSRPSMPSWNEKEVHAQSAGSGKPLFGWGFDPIFFDGERMQAKHLDRVSRTRPILVLHQTFHTLNVNTAVLEAAGITESARVEGLHLGADGKPTGELREFAIMYLALAAVKADLLSAEIEDRNAWDYVRIANRAGTTTTCDMAKALSDETLEVLTRVTNGPEFPIRLVPFLVARGDPKSNIERLSSLVKQSNAKLKLGRVKIITDGAITGLTARLLPSGYYNSAPNGQWNMTPDELRRQFEAYHRAGYQLHIHVNGDEASAMTLEVPEQVLPAYPKPGLRHTLQHCQLMDEGQFRRAKALDVVANIFVNHIYYYGDEHYRQTLRPERSARMDATATALRVGVAIAIHSDSPVTPLGPLFTAWEAINRRTAGGRVLGPEEALTLEQALYAITMGAAYSLQLEGEIGSIVDGKLADFTVLEDDPYAVGPAKLKDIPIWGTVVGGKPFPVPAAVP